MSPSQFVITTITITASALAGAAAMMGFRILLKRRRLMAALYTELLENHARCHTLSEVDDHALGDSLVRAPNTEFDRTAFDLVKKDAPLLYAKLRRHSENLSMSYHHMRAFDYVNNDASTLYQRYNRDDPEESEVYEIELEEMKKFVDDIIDILEGSFKESMEEIKDYSRKSLFRRIIYWNCF